MEEESGALRGGVWNRAQLLSLYGENTRSPAPPPFLCWTVDRGWVRGRNLEWLSWKIRWKTLLKTVKPQDRRSVDPW